MAHEVKEMIIARRNGQPVTALLLNERMEVPFAECPPPDYISGFFYIQIAYILLKKVRVFYIIIVSVSWTIKYWHSSSSYLIA
jgi:hypothetical protein